MNKLSKEKQQQLLLVSIGSVVVLGLIWFFGIQPLQSRLTQLGTKITESHQKEDDARKLVKQTSQIHEELDGLAKKLGAIEDRMVAGDTNVWIRSEIIQFKSTGFYKVEIPSYSTAAGVKVDVFPEFPYKAARYLVSGTAYFHDLGRFLADFENYFPNIRVQNLEISPLESLELERREKLAFSMELVALIKPPANKPGSP